MIYLRRHDVFREIAVLGLPSSVPNLTDRATLGASIKTCGAYAFFSKTFIATFRYQGTLYLRWGSSVIPWTNSIRICRAVNKSGQVSLKLEGPGICQTLNYWAPVLDPPLSQIHEPFSEQEDFDFGLFLSNLSMDAGRRERVFLRGNDLPPEKCTSGNVSKHKDP